MTSFECTNSVFHITNENISFSITIPGQWDSTSAEKTIDELNVLLELRSNDMHEKEVRKRGIKIKTKDNEYKLSDFDTQRNEILEKLKKANYNDIEDLVYRMQLTYDEAIDIVDLKYIPTERTGYSLNPSFYEVVDLNNTLKKILPDNVKVSLTTDDTRFQLKSNLKKNQTLIFTKKSFFYTIFGFTRSHSYPLDDKNWFHQLIAGSY